jgi:hypothetical protein
VQVPLKATKGSLPFPSLCFRKFLGILRLPFAHSGNSGHGDCPTCCCFELVPHLQSAPVQAFEGTGWRVNNIIRACPKVCLRASSLLCPSLRGALQVVAFKSTC